MLQTVDGVRLPVVDLGGNSSHPIYGIAQLGGGVSPSSFSHRNNQSPTHYTELPYLFQTTGLK